MMRVLAAIVVPPHLAVSGGARAGEELSRAAAGACVMSIASMLAGGNGPGKDRGMVRRVPVRAGLPFGLSLERVPRRYKSLFYRSDIPALISPDAYDLVHLHNPMPALEMRRIAKACQAKGVPYVVSTHGFNEVVNGLTIYGFGALRREVWRRLVVDPVSDVVKGAAEIFALSPADLPLLAALGHQGDNVSIVTNGVHPPPPGEPAEDASLLAGLGVEPRRPDGPPTLMFLANHTPNKGLPGLFAALRELKEPFQLIVGGEPRPEVDYLAAQAACRPGQTLVVTGQLTDQEVAACFRRADLFVFPTLADTLPLVVLEAMAYGLPVLATEVGGIPYQLGEGCGLTVPPGDVDALARALSRVIADPALRARLGAAAQARVASAFTWERSAEIAVERYAAILARQPAAARSAKALPFGRVRARRGF